MADLPGRVDLARRETPIERLRRLPESLELPGELYVKRDDLTGAALSGNKVRKLEFLLYEALQQGAGAVVTCGGIQSNHCRATAVAAARLGLGCTVVLRGSPPPGSGLGNLLIDRLVGARVRWVSAEEYRTRRAEVMEEEAESWRREGQEAYVIPEGGSNALGSCGYVDVAREIAQAERELGLSFDVVAHAVGSGGTAAGLAAGREAYGLRYELLGFPVCDDAAFFEARVGEILQELDRYVPGASRGRARFEDAYKGIGYAQSTPEEEAFLQQVARREGLILDPAYTCKAFLGLTRELFSGRLGSDPRVLFIHTGGIFGTLSRPWKLYE